jgi:hypothetical protein
MTQDDVLFGYRQQLFAEAARTSVSAACRTFGVLRSTSYASKRRGDRHGLEILRPRERRRPQMPNQLAKMDERTHRLVLDRRSKAGTQARGLGAAAREARPARRPPHPHAERPQTNGHVEALHKTILDECWRPAFAR